MHTPSPAGGNTPPRRGRPRRRWLTWPPMRHAAPVAVVALYGAAWIAVHAGGGRVAAGMCLGRRREIAGLRSRTVHPASEPERCVQRTGSDTPGGPR
jgi:hypothetical protein